MTPKRLLFLGIFASAVLCIQTVIAAPDEDRLGKAQGYPIAASIKTAFREPYLVGSFSAMERLQQHCTLAPGRNPPVLKQAATETSFTYQYKDQALMLYDYMNRQRATAVLVLKDGEIVAERYNYARTPEMHMLSNSMAKTIVALVLGKAREEGLIRSFDDTAETYVPALKGTLYGGTKLVNLMRMASGARYVEDYSAHDDRSRFNAAARSDGVAKAAATVTERADPEGEKFNYASAQTMMLGLVLRAATGRTLCDYVDEKIWQPMGAESPATWLVNPVDQVELASGTFNATVRDYARLGALMANDGQALGQQVVPREHLLDMTDRNRQPEAFRPGHMEWHGSHYAGYGLQTWLLPGATRRFVLLGVYGQAIFVDPALKLVMVHTAVGKDASGDASGTHLGAERDALWRGVLAHYAR